MNEMGDGEAARVYRLRADQGDAEALYNLGVFYEQGRGGLPKDEREAARRYKLAADQGHAKAQNNLLCAGPRRAPQARLFRLAADQVYASAQCNLAINYTFGYGGLPKDEREVSTRHS
jgi:TPR repeat protein